MRKFLLFSLLFLVVACSQLSAMKRDIVVDASVVEADGRTAFDSDTTAVDPVADQGAVPSRWQRFKDRVRFWESGDVAVEGNEADDDGEQKRRPSFLCKCFVYGGIALVAIFIVGGGAAGIAGSIAYREGMSHGMQVGENSVLRAQGVATLRAMNRCISPDHIYDLSGAEPCLSVIEEFEQWAQPKNYDSSEGHPIDHPSYRWCGISPDSPSTRYLHSKVNKNCYALGRANTKNDLMILKVFNGDDFVGYCSEPIIRNGSEISDLTGYGDCSYEMDSQKNDHKKSIFSWLAFLLSGGFFCD